MALTIFLKLGTMLDIDKLRKVTEPDYPKKIGSSIKYENVVKRGIFSKMALTILIKRCQMVEEIDTKHLQKTAGQELTLFSRYSSIKFRFSPKTAKVVSKDRSISREQ